MDSVKTNFAVVGVLVALALLALPLVQPEKPAADPEVMMAHVNLLASSVNQMRLASKQEVRAPVLQLPEDGRKWYTVLIYRDKALTDQADRHLAAMVATTPRLQSLTAQTKVLGWDQKDPLYVERYRQFFGDRLPAIIVQNDAGRVLYKVSGSHVPIDGEALADEIAASIGQTSSLRPRPVQPNPQQPEQIPDIRPQNGEGKQDLLWVLLLPLAGGAYGLYRHFRQKQS
jgi:hypothetical protein